MVDDEAFRQWLVQKSWIQAVRYSKTVFWLMLPAVLALDVPLAVQGLLDTAPARWLVAWQASVVLTCCAVVLVDRWPAMRGKEALLYLFCTLFMVLTTWAGVRSQLIGGSGMIVYVGGCTFIAAVICTPRPVRRPLYAISLVALAVPAWVLAGDVVKVFEALVIPFCFIVLCVELDRFTYSQQRAHFRDKQRAESECARADKVLCNVLPAPIADELKRAGAVQAVKFENMGVLFADIAGFTAYSRSLPPDALVLVLNQIFSAFDELVDRHGLEKIKTIGDAYMVISYHRIEALCAMALDMHRAMAAYNRANGTSLAMRIGLHAGPAVAGVIGVRRFLYDVWGDTVNLASRMEESSEPGAILVTEAVVRQAGGALCFEPRGLQMIRGRGPVATYRLVDQGHRAAQPAPESATVPETFHSG